MYQIHNMIIDDEWDKKDTNEYFFDNIQDGVLVDNVHTFLDFKAIRMSYMNEGEHYQLRNVFIEHLWTRNEKKLNIYINHFYSAFLLFYF